MVVGAVLNPQVVGAVLTKPSAGARARIGAEEQRLEWKEFEEPSLELKAEREVQLRVVERRRQEDGSVASLQCEHDSGCGEEPVRLRRGPGAM